LYGRNYPADILADELREGRLNKDSLRCIKAGDMKAIAVPTDFLGVNHYTRMVTRSQSISEDHNLPPTVIQPPRDRVNCTDMDWEIYPQGLYQVLCRLYFEYQVPKIYITENGCSFSDRPDKSGHIHDERRINYLRDYLTAAQRAMLAGVPLKGYFVWSLLDNFEWAKGYSQRFGINWVDFKTQERLPKDSALWYRKVISESGFSLE
jgi:beta-glucosidase